MGIINTVLDLLYPPKCVFCGRILDSSGYAVCDGCDEKIDTPHGREVHLKGNFISDGVAPLYYEDLVRESILRYKFNGKSGYAKTYAEIMAKCIESELYEEFDILTWVPVSRKRLRKRGYDQAELLAEGIGKCLGISAVPTIRKTVNNPPQSGIKDAERRRANVLGAYEIIDKKLIENRKILIVDDIFTTGATISECAKTLLLGGADVILCAAIAKTR